MPFFFFFFSAVNDCLTYRITDLNGGFNLTNSSEPQLLGFLRLGFYFCMECRLRVVSLFLFFLFFFFSPSPGDSVEVLTSALLVLQLSNHFLDPWTASWLGCCCGFFPLDHRVSSIHGGKRIRSDDRQPRFLIRCAVVLAGPRNPSVDFLHVL